MKISELSESKYLKKEDVMPPMTVTISGIMMENLAQQGQPPEMKAVLQFSEAVKPMVMNPTNAQLIAHINGSEETDDWIGQKITLHNDPSISYSGRLTGGIRVVMPQVQAAQAAPQSENPAEGMDSTPF